MRVQEIFAKNLRAERKKLRLSQAKVAELVGISLSFYQTLELATKFPSPEKISDIANCFRVPVYKLFIERPEIDEMSSSELLDRFSEFLVGRYKQEVASAKTDFVKGLEAEKETGINPFEGEEMFKE